MSRHFASLRSLAAAATTLTATMALAAPPDAPLTMQITAPKPRFDVEVLCPEIQQQLPDALARAWHDIAASGTVDVLMTVKGRHVQRVETTDGPLELQRAVRRAAKLSLDCRTAESTPQLVAFRVHFVDWPAGSSAQAGGLAIVRLAGQ